MITVTPFPILASNGETVTLEIQITVLEGETIPVGAQVALNLVLEGIIPIKIPCLDLGDLLPIPIGSW